MGKEWSDLLQDVKTYLYEDESLIKLPKIKSSPKRLSTFPEKTEGQDLLKKKESVVEPTQNPKEIEQEVSSIHSLTSRLQSCHACVLARTRCHVVVGSGNPESMLYIIGEGPGQEEDLQGKPFVGRSGQLLTRMLEAIAVSREDIFITNIVKCRPPGNRNPLPEEIEACTPHLKAQLEYGKPKVLLALGRYSAGFLLNDYKSSLGSFRGFFHQSEYGNVVVTYHPAAVLRSPNQRKPMVWEDLKFLAQYLYQQGFYNSEQIEILKTNKALEN